MSKMCTNGGGFTLELNTENKAVADDLISRIRRIHKLSEKPHNPGYAYRHLEHIHALCEMILKEYPLDENTTRSNPQPQVATIRPLELKPPTPGAALPFRM